MMNFLPTDIINYINEFLQRTDQIAWKITSKYYLTNLKYNLMDLNGELNLFTKTIDELDYAWKGDTRYINIRSFPQNLANYSILNSYAVITNLWYFDFNAEFDVYADKYIILFLTSVSDYQMNIEYTNGITGQITKTTYKPISNKIKVKFDDKGRIKVNCREISKLKDLKTIQYMMCIPQYYWKKIKSYKGKHMDWKKQILMTRDVLTVMKMMRNFN
jgi:hypothetical protein